MTYHIKTNTTKEKKNRNISMTTISKISKRWII